MGLMEPRGHEVQAPSVPIDLTHPAYDLPEGAVCPTCGLPMPPGGGRSCRAGAAALEQEARELAERRAKTRAWAEDVARKAEG